MESESIEDKVSRILGIYPKLINDYTVNKAEEFGKGIDMWI